VLRWFAILAYCIVAAEVANVNWLVKYLMGKAIEPGAGRQILSSGFEHRLMGTRDRLNRMAFESGGRQRM